MIIGYTAGVFDLFHIGHLNLLRNARGLCDRLVVGVSTDELVSYKYKRAVIPFHERLEIVRSLKCVDAAIPQRDMNKMEMWNRIRFDIMFVGDDWYQTEKWQEYEAQLQQVDVKIVYFPYTQNTSSTLINEVLNNLRKP